MAKISVIMPVYNTYDRSVLEKSINSILDQTFRDFELIICDDYSDDGTYELLKDLINNKPNIILIRNKFNSGVSLTRNRCIDLASGDYIALQDCDDWSSPDRLELQFNFLQNNKEFSFVGSRTFFVKEDVIEVSPHYIPTPEKRDFLYTLPFTHSACMLRKNLLSEINGYRISRETVFRAEDYDMFMRIYAIGHVGYILPEKLYYYRLNTNSSRKKKYKYFIHETIVRYKGFTGMGIPLIKSLPYIVKPIISSVLPLNILKFFRDRYLNKKK